MFKAPFTGIYFINGRIKNLHFQSAPTSCGQIVIQIHQQIQLTTCKSKHTLKPIVANLTSHVLTDMFMSITIESEEQFVRKVNQLLLIYIYYNHP